jgi:uncharacterized protein YciI
MHFDSQPEANAVDAVNQIEVIKAKMLKTSFFAMFRTLKDPAKMQAGRLEHVQWLLDLEKRDLIFASGPLVRRDGSTDPGLTIWEVTAAAVTPSRV